jgi:hypothetical protein
MKCEHSEQLIPFYIGGDLEPLEAESLRQHLETCVPCRQLHEEFAASQTWLSEFAAPDFSAAIYADLSPSVIRKIEQQEKRGSWFQWLLPKWNPRLMLVTSAAALAIVTALMAVTYYQQQSLVTTSNNKLANGAKLTSPEKRPSPTPEDSTRVREQKVIASSATFSRRPVKPVAAETPLPPEANQNDPFAAPPLEELATDATNTEIVAITEPEEPQMTRIEFQTADPNIRIIWFAPKSDTSLMNKTK